MARTTDDQGRRVSAALALLVLLTAAPLAAQQQPRPVEENPKTPQRVEQKPGAQQTAPRKAAPGIEASQADTSHPERADKRSNDSKNTPQPWWDKAWQRAWNDPFAAAVAIFTFLLVIVGWCQARRLRQTIVSMERSAERQLRAYV